MLEALGESSIEKAIEVMKQLTKEFIIEQEKEDQLNREIDALLDGVDFTEPLSPVYVPHSSHESMSTHTTSFKVQVSTVSFLKNIILLV